MARPGQSTQAEPMHKYTNSQHHSPGLWVPKCSSGPFTSASVVLLLDTCGLTTEPRDGFFLQIYYFGDVTEALPLTPIWKYGECKGRTQNGKRIRDSGGEESRQSDTEFTLGGTLVTWLEILSIESERVSPVKPRPLLILLKRLEKRTVGRQSLAGLVYYMRWRWADKGSPLQGIVPDSFCG